MINTEKSKRLDGQLYYNQDPLLLEEHLNVQMLLICLRTNVRNVGNS